jgi:LSD1 subclass zinc finger protein
VNPISIEMEQDWRGAGDGLIVLIVLVAYMAAIHKLIEWNRISENVAKVLWGTACLLPLGYFLSFSATFSAIGIAAFGLFYWFVGREILSTTLAQRKNLEEMRRTIEIDDAKQVGNPVTSGTPSENSSSVPQNGIEPNIKRQPTDSTQKIIVSCPSCEQKLRIPIGKALNVSCAWCQTKFLVAASGEIVPHKFRIIETVRSGPTAVVAEDVSHGEVNLAAKSIRCHACGLERQISSPEAQGFHCARCMQYNLVENAVRSEDCGPDQENSIIASELNGATVCAVIGCNEAVPPGRIVCPRHG